MSVSQREPRAPWRGPLAWLLAALALASAAGSASWAGEWHVDTEADSNRIAFLSEVSVLSFEGTGRVREQSPRPGARLSRGDRVTVRCGS